MTEEVDGINKTVKESVANGHYQSSLLTVFTRTLNEKISSIAKIFKEKKRIVKGACDFHNNYNKVFIYDLFKYIYIYYILWVWFS